MATRQYPLFYDATNTDCRLEQMGNDDCIYVENLPLEVPNDFSEISAGTQVTAGTQVWYEGALYACTVTHNRSSVTNPSTDTSRWNRVGSHPLDTVRGDSGTPQNSASDQGFRTLAFAFNETSSGGSSFVASGNDTANATVTLNLDTSGFSGGGTNPRAPGDGLVLDGNELDLDPVVRNQILLINGFLVLTRGSTTGTRTAYTGIIAGYPSATYYFDTSDSSWYDAVTAGNRLIGF